MALQNPYQYEQCRACQSCDSQRRYANTGHGQRCRYDQANDRPTTGENEIVPKMSKKCTETSTSRWWPPPDTGCDHSTEESEYLEDSSLGMSAASMCSSEPSPSLKPRSIFCRPKNSMNRMIINRSELEECRQALRRVFEDCSMPEFQSISCAISCVLNSGRLLTRCELVAAANLFLLDNGIPIREQQRIRVEDWLRKCHPILLDTLDGKIDFVHSRAMKAFLRSFRIRGIDTSHRTLGVVCRNYIELSRHLMRDVRTQSIGLGVHQAVKALSEYVTAFGNHHLRLASFTSTAVLEQQECSRFLTQASCSDTEEDFEVIQTGTKQLSLSEERDDWVMLHQP